VVVLHLLEYPIVMLTALFNEMLYRVPTVMPAWEALRMATIEGAQEIGLGDEIGSPEVGKQADLILVDLTAPNLSPVLEVPVRDIVPSPVLLLAKHPATSRTVATR
jgi:5-methylthioadenosine/S-adenosylhomocysteine deaminase